MRNVRIFGLDKLTRNSFNRALRLMNAGSQAQFVRTAILRFIASARARHGDLSVALTEEERWIADVIYSGAAEPVQIAELSGFKLARVVRLIEDLKDLGIVKEEKQGGKTEAARGARRPIYFVTEKYVPSPDVLEQIPL